HAVRRLQALRQRARVGRVRPARLPRGQGDARCRGTGMSAGDLATAAAGAAAHAADEVPELSRTLRPRHVTMISLGGIIGAGLFVGSSVAIAATGPMVIVTYVLTGLMVLIVMRCLGEMAVSRPDIRSFTEFARAGFGNWAGFTVGWLYWYFWIIVIPVEAIAGAVILQH